MIMTRLVSVAALSALLAASVAAEQARLSFDDPDDVITMARKVGCSTVDGEPITYYWHGHAYSRIRGEPDRRLFRVEGMNVRTCVTHEHPDHGTGYRQVSREIMLYLDPESLEVLSTWDNPWTGETVQVLHVANDPVNMRSPRFAHGPDGPARFTGHVEGNTFWQNITFPLWYSNPLGGDYQAEVGGTYQATEMFNFFGRVDDLTDPETTTADVQVGWARMSDWLPWMRMHGRQGLIYFHAAGTKLAHWDDLPEVLKDEIDRHYPEYREAPPLDDDRANVTSWTYFKDIAEGRIEAPDRAGERDEDD
ncbi:MAG: DUF1838 domain-containing protein [Wenzhouxiangella sp.]|nr:MAG: DUF1838 domain-containing protein [Wenzhouxiangella sp.]